MDKRFGSFIWDPKKEAVNVAKHGIDFGKAARAFKDVNRKVFADERHSNAEQRLFCIGKVDGRIITVRFTYRNGLIRIYGAGYWRKGRAYYESQSA
jgi:uncharacterized protein